MLYPKIVFKTKRPSFDLNIKDRHVCKKRQGHDNDHWYGCMTAGPRKELRRKHTEYIRTATELRLILALTQ